jgi:class 3 adenylate cyclase
MHGLDPALHRMMDAVHQCERTVNDVAGDGIMAMLGAPVTHDERIDTMLVRWFPKPAAVGKLLFHKPKRLTMEEKAYDNRSDPA